MTAIVFVVHLPILFHLSVSLLPKLCHYMSAYIAIMEVMSSCVGGSKVPPGIYQGAAGAISTSEVLYQLPVISKHN